jgi:signal peptidase II
MQNKIIKFQNLVKNFFKNKKILGYILYGLNIIFLDRITKYIALYCHEIYFAPFQRLLHLPPIKNYGMSFNLFFITQENFIFFLRIIGICITFYFYKRAVQKYNENKDIFAEVTIIAGAIGNLIDRFYYSFVIDFIFFTFPFSNYIAIANIADFAITLGCTHLILNTLIDDIIYYKRR